VTYNGVSSVLQSALLISAGLLQPNRTYQFMVHMQKKQNQSQQVTGYVLVRVEGTFQRIISIG
jgi:hypothetical protein